MKFAVLLLILSTLGIFAKDVTKIHDWIQKNIQSLEKYIQETDMSSDMLLGIQRNDQVKNYQNWIFSTNHKQHIELTDGQVKKTNAFGPESEYFTETTQNLVFLGTQIKDKEWIKIQMKKGNEDVQRIDMFNQENYQGVSLINSNNEGTLNRLLIVEKKNEIISSYEEHGKSIILLSNLSEGQSLFYVLYSQNSEVSDIEKLFNYIVKNVIDIEKETDIKADEQPVDQEDGEEESDPNDLEKLKKNKGKGEGEGEEEGEEKGEEDDKKGEEQVEEQVEEKHDQEVPEEDCPGGEEDDTVKNKVDVDPTSQLPPQQDPKNVKIQTNNVNSEETVEIVEETEEEEENIVPEKAQTVGGKSSLPPKKDQEEDANSEPEPPSEEYQNCAGEELDTVKNKRDLNENLESKQDRVFQAKEVSIQETIHEEEGEGDEKKDADGKKEGDGNADEKKEGDGNTDEKKEGDGNADEKKEGDGNADEKKEGDGNVDEKKEGDGNTDADEKKDADGKKEGDGNTNKNEVDEPCVILYSECHYTGDELKLCGAHPVIPNDMKNFKVKSIKVPEGVQVTFFNKPNFDDERLHAKTEMECLETPLRLNLLELMNNLRMSKQVNINSISVTK